MQSIGSRRYHLHGIFWFDEIDIRTSELILDMINDNDYCKKNEFIYICKSYKKDMHANVSSTSS